MCLAKEHQQVAECEIGNFVTKNARGVEDRHANCGGVNFIDPIGADAPFDDCFQPIGLANVEHLRIDRIIAGDNGLYANNVLCHFRC